jgi:hypothetical protein
MPTDVLELEAFDGEMQGRKILQYTNDATGTSVLGVLANNYERKVLICSAARSPTLWFKAGWDVIFQIRDNKEWLHVLTYIAHAPKPMCVVAEEGAEIPEVVMNRLSGAAGITILCQRRLGAHVPQGYQQPRLGVYDIIFMPPIADPRSAEADACLAIIGSLMGASASIGAAVETRRAWLKELRSAEAGICWSRTAGVSWYDPADVMPRHIGSGAGQVQAQAQAVAGHLRVLADMLGSACRG